MKDQIRKILLEKATVKEQYLARFFKIGKGEYAEHDKFLGVTAPNLRVIASQYKNLCLDDLQDIISSPFNEERLLALLILSSQFKENSQEVYQFYLQNIDYVNNWNLVDNSAHLIIGAYHENKPRDLLYELALSTSLWKRRIAMVSTWWFIKKNDLEDTFLLAKNLLNDKHDLIHKAAGWMLREAGKRDQIRLVSFLNKYKYEMPRTMLRYAIEKFPKEERQEFLKKVVLS